MKRFVTLLVGLALVWAPNLASAQVTSQCQTYGSETCHVTQPSGTLPFTGVNVWLLVVVGGGLLGAGVLVRRVSHHSS